MAFQSTLEESIVVWRGNPNCIAAETYVREWLRQNVHPYPSAWIPGNLALQGNLGECIAFCCADCSWEPLPHCFPANAFTPFSGISKNEIDLLWIRFDEDPSRDQVIHQEVKTTASLNLAYARRLLDDYRKSFGANLRVTLNTHLHAAKSRLKYLRAPDLAKRITALQADTPQNADRVLAIPTLVHDLESEDPVPKMAGIEAELRADGWQKVECWALGLSMLEVRLRNMTEDTA